MPSGQRGDMIDPLHHFGMGIGGCGRKGAAREHRQVGPVVPNGGRLSPIQAQGIQRGLCCWTFDFCRKMGVFYTQGFQAQAQGWRVTPGDDHRGNARLLQQLDTQAIQNAEAFEGLALV